MAPLSISTMAIFFRLLTRRRASRREMRSPVHSPSFFRARMEAVAKRPVPSIELLPVRNMDHDYVQNPKRTSSIGCNGLGSGESREPSSRSQKFVRLTLLHDPAVVNHQHVISVL